MPPRRPSSATACAALARAALLAAAIALVPGNAEARPPKAPPSPVWTWLGETAAHALRAAASTDQPARGGVAALNRTVESGLHALHHLGPDWSQRLDVDLRLRDDQRLRYAVGTRQPLFTSRSRRDRWFVDGRFNHDPGVLTRGRLGLKLRRDQNGTHFTVGLDASLEERRLDDTRRFTVGAQFRSRPLALRVLAVDDVPRTAQSDRARRRRPLDGYDLQLEARVPFVPWARLKANRFWQIAIDGSAETARDRFSLRLKPLAPLEIETGSVGSNGERGWFAQLRVTVRLGERS